MPIHESSSAEQKIYWFQAMESLLNLAYEVYSVGEIMSVN